MATTEQFSLRWNNFHSNITSGFHDLLQANEMVDVTLAVDGQFLQAHKIVLSICSPFFKQLFKLNPCKHPVIILRDVTYGNLKDILEFMYLGEVNVLRDNLSTFLRTAELLQVKGLTGDDSSETSSRHDDKSESNCDNDLEQDLRQLLEPKSPLMPLPLTSPQSSLPPVPICNLKRPKNSTNNNKRVKSEIKSTKSSEDEIELPEIEPKLESTDDNPANNNIIKQLLENNLSGQDTTISQDGKTEEKVNSHPYKCEKCIKRFSRRDHLRTHEKNIHGEDAGPFACYICAQLYKNAESLRKHIAKFHCHKINEVNQKVPTDIKTDNNY